MPKLRILVYEDEFQAFEALCSSGIEVGRQICVVGGYSEPVPYTVFSNPVLGPRLIVVPQTRNSVPRRCFRAHIDGAGLRIENVHSLQTLTLSNGVTVGPGNSISLPYDAMIELTPGLLIRVELSFDESKIDSQSYQSLSSSPPTPDLYKSKAITQTLMDLVGSRPAPIPDSKSLQPRIGIETEDELVERPLSATSDIPVDDADFSDPSSLVGQGPHDVGSSAPVAANPILALLRTTLDVVREVSGSDAFFAASVRAAGEIVGLDRATLLMRDGEANWKVRATYERPSAAKSNRETSRTILKKVAETGRTQIYDAASWKDAGESLRKVNFALGSPVLDRQGKVVAVLYGDRRASIDQSVNRITEIEATFVEILAGAIAAGIVRKEEEDRRSALTGFFSPRVADLLFSRPELLEPKEAEVSVLFCDIRGFSGVTEDSPPELTFKWLQDVLSEVSQCVVDLDGVVVDYVGDQLFATWGAPDAQADHQERALKACIEILDKTQILQERWASQIDKPFSLGIGVSTGYAQAGNVGSRQKFKYGVLGNTVNLGSRLQDATKQLGVDCIAEATCIRGAGWENRSRRLTKLQVTGIDGVVEAYEIVADTVDPNSFGMSLPPDEWHSTHVPSRWKG